MSLRSAHTRHATRSTLRRRNRFLTDRQSVGPASSLFGPERCRDSPPLLGFLNYVPNLFSYLYRKPASLVAFLSDEYRFCMNVVRSEERRVGEEGRGRWRRRG